MAEIFPKLPFNDSGYLKTLERIAQSLERIEANGKDVNRVLDDAFDGKALKNYSKQVEKTEKRSNKLAGTIKKLGAAIVAAFSIREIVRFGAESARLFSQQITAEKQLLAALKGREDIQKRLIKDAAKLQKQSIFGDEEIIKQQQFLASLRFTEKQIKQIIRASIDASAALGISLESAVRNTAKTFSGLSGELGELVPSLRNFSQEQLKSGAAVKEFNKLFGGQGKILARVGDGPLKQLNNAYGDFKESIGETATAIRNRFIPELQRLIIDGEKFARILLRLVDPIKALNDELEEQASSLSDIQTNVKPLIIRYDELKSKSKLTTEEQIELNNIIKEIGEKIPSAVTSVDNYGDALDINREKVDDFTLSLEALTLGLKTQTEQQLRQSLLAIEKERDELKKLFDEKKRIVIGPGGERVPQSLGKVDEIKAGKIQQERARQIANLTKKIEEYEKRLIEINKIVISPQPEDLLELQNELLNTADAAEEFVEETEKVLSKEQLEELKKRREEAAKELEKFKESLLDLGFTAEQVANVSLEDINKTFEEIFGTINTGNVAGGVDFGPVNQSFRQEEIDGLLYAIFGGEEGLKAAIKNFEDEQIKDIGDALKNIAEGVTSQEALDAAEANADRSKLDKFYARLLTPSDKTGASTLDYIQEAFNVAFELSGGTIDLLLQNSQRQLDIIDAQLSAIDARINEAQTRLDEELARQEAGDANSVQRERERLAALNRERQKALREREKIEKKQAEIERARAIQQQIQDTVTAGISIIRSQAKGGLLGLLLAGAAISTLFGLIASLKKRARADIPSFHAGGEPAGETPSWFGNDKPGAGGGKPIIVGGNEYIMPKKQTQANKGFLERMRSGEFDQVNLETLVDGQKAPIEKMASRLNVVNREAENQKLDAIKDEIRLQTRLLLEDNKMYHGKEIVEVGGEKMILQKRIGGNTLSTLDIKKLLRN